MQILYLIKKEPTETSTAIIEEQRKMHEIEVIDLRNTPDYDSILERIAAADRVISW